MYCTKSDPKKIGRRNCYEKRLLPLLLSTALILPLLCPAAAAEETTTRRDLADALYALANRPSVSQTQLYSDLTEADDALHWISSEGYMVGYGSHTMAPDQAITRNQLATVLYEYAKEHNLALTKRAPIEAGTPKWADDAISWATANGVLDGIDRDQAITASELDRALSNLSKVAEDPAAKDLNAIMDSPGVSGYAVMAYRDGELIYQRTGGDRYIDAADPANNLPLELDSRYRTASISKTFAAVGAMRLVEQGKLDLDRDVSDYLGFTLRNPNYPDKAITTRMLLSHTSSIQDGSVYSIAPEYSVKEFFTPEGKYWMDGEHFENSTDGVDRSPGNWFHYCNLNYGLVGTIIERITGQRFDIYMRENVLEPMGLKASYNPGDFDADEIQNVATLYQKQTDGVWDEDGPYIAQIDDYRGVPQDPNKVLITNPDLQSAITLEPLDDYVIGTNGCLFSPQGGLRISPNEMKVLIEMFLNNGKVNGTQIISKESVDAMFTPTFCALPDQSNGNTYGGLMCRYGFGIQEMSGEFEGGDCLLKDRKISLSGHFGEAYGLLAGFFLDRETGTAIYYAMTGQGSEDAQNAGEYSGMYKWEEMFCTALLDNLFPDL